MSDVNEVEYPLTPRQTLIEAKCILNRLELINDENKKIIDSLSYWISDSRMTYKSTMIHAAQALSKVEDKTVFERRIISSLHRIIDELNNGA